MKKRNVTVLVLACAAILVGWIGIAFEQSGLTLPPGAVHVVANSGVLSSGFPRVETGLAPYFWVPRAARSQTVRAAGPGPSVGAAANSAADVDLVYPDFYTQSPRLIYRYHLTAANTLELDSDPPTSIPAGGWPIEPTPDGAGMLYDTTNRVRPHDPDLHFLSADGKTDRLLPALWMMDRVWMPDGKHWIISREEGDFLNGLDGVPLHKLNTQLVSSLHPFVLAISPQGHAIATVLGSGRFLAPGSPYSNAAFNYPEMRLFEFDVNAPLGVLRQWRVRVPARAVAGDAVISPDTKRILWIVVEPEQGFVRWMRRIWRRKPQVETAGVAVYISSIDGSGMHRLAYAPRLPASPGRRMPTTLNMFTNFRWLPDSRRVSFTYNGALYIAPVD